MTIETALEWIHSRLKFNIRPGLTRIEALLKLLGNPEKELSMLHIAGTNKAISPERMPSWMQLS